MENKKGAFQNNTSVQSDVPFESIPKHQHNTAPQHLRLLQYGLKIPNNQHQLNSPNVHQHMHQSAYQPSNHLHLSSQSPQYNTANIHANPIHQHYNNHQYHVYQHPKTKQNVIYQPKMNPPANIHPHNPLNQQSQIWVPHQPPVHYHPAKVEAQTPVQQQSTPNSTPQNKPTKEVIERRKSGNSQQLRSPSAKRPIDAPVTLQGWLHKQGSEGLMLWKKRWFVLSEYCLFYYKGREEEKLLGSILLPSYKVSICGPDDKVNKKYAFKCEHTNMRTYILAADSQELMMQWVRVLNLACLLQSNVESDQSLVNTSKAYSYSNENSDSSFQQQNNNSRNTPIHMHSSSNTTDLSNPSHDFSQYNQPLYANAPPKPRRLNDGGYSSPSPDVLDRYNEPTYVTLQPPMYMSRSSTESPSLIYGNQEYVPRPEQTYNLSQHLVQNVERRTPDTYGRSKSHHSKGRHPSDYEDIYAEQYIYKRPLSPLAYNTKKTINVITPIQRTYTPVSILGQRDIQYSSNMNKSSSTIPRPHSADFLEYEVNNRQNNNNLIHRQQRPKSSLEINRNSDNYFYSEERYAEKMRKSAQYLSKLPKYSQGRPEHTDYTFPLMRSNTQFMQYPPAEYSRKDQPLRSRSVLSEGSLSKELDIDLRTSPHEKAIQDQTCDDRMADYDPFTRSASARLANIEQRLQGDGRANMNKEGERKREESMKRLLEWKQRMLQSPLNRKMSQNMNKYITKPEQFYKNQDNYGHKICDTYMENRRSANPFTHYNSYSSDDEASGSISLKARDTFPRTISCKRMWPPNSQQMQSKSTSNLNRSHESDYSISSRQGYYLSHTSSQHDINSDNNKVNWNEKINVSAGDLLGRTHEELILLLIQLRRQSTNTCHAIEGCYNEIDSIQAQLHLLDATKRLENLQKLEQIKQHLLELEKQYEKGKPLVNLVDNMVKLGSLYRSPNDRSSYNTCVRDQLEFNQQIQERRLLAEERRDWNRLNPNHMQLQEKVQQLYQLDQLIQEESGTLQRLQHDKEEIERALGGLRRRLSQGFSDPAKIEQARKQQAILENELSRVHLMLAQNSKKLEETVAGNARLEQELLVLKQKLQISRHNRSSPQFSNAGDSLPCVVGTSAMLESDLQRVQQKVGDLQRQRQELSMQVRQLTDRSNNLEQQMKPLSASNSQNIQGLGNKKKMHSLWRETDLDTMNIIDHGDTWESSTPTTSTTPLYVNTDLKQNIEGDFYSRSVSDITSDDTNKSLIPQEKQEIKTVRIVKRESERRHRDREKTTVVNNAWDAVAEEDDSSQNSSLLFRPTPLKKQSTPETNESTENQKSDSLSLDNFETENLEKSPELSPVFKSEAARQIITEMAHEQPKQLNRRVIPKEKRRHYTAPHNNLIMKSLNELPAGENPFDKMLASNNRRARDDLDMERALRQRIDAPDVVRSTLSNKELKYNESTIDNLLGTPNKIEIPERYIPEQLPQLSAEEQEYRLRKVESIKKMLSDTTIISASSASLNTEENNENTSSVANKATTKMIEEKKQREHLLQLNQILAKQVMEMSKIVAGSNNADDHE